MKERCYVSDEASFQAALLQVKHHLAEQAFSAVQTARFLTAVSELARNILKYVGAGVIEVTPVFSLDKKGIEVIAKDKGTGIENIELAMKDKYSSSGTLGQGLPGAKRLVDEFYLESSCKGTIITIRSWH